MKETEARGQVRVYVSPACPHCHQLTAWLDANEVAYERLDVTEMVNARAEILKLSGGLTIPVLCCGGDVVVGFDRRRVMDVLHIDAERGSAEGVSSGRVPQADPDRAAEWVEKAKELLSANRADSGTRASRHLYPHQWNWDAGFIARGYLHYDPTLTYKEIRSLFAGQWSDGFLPHIVFNPGYLDHFPGPDYWRTELSDRVPAGVYTSAISQPAVHASMLCVAAELDPDRERGVGFLAEMYPKLKSLHDFFFRYRDPNGENLVSLVHPWESGLDNAPVWDAPRARR